MSSKPAAMRVLALPLSRPTPTRPAFVYYHVQSPPKPRTANPNWFQRSTDKALSAWAALGEAPKDTWKYKTFAWGERMVDRVEFEESALRLVDTSSPPPAPASNLQVEGKESEKATETSKDLVTFLYPSLFPNGLSTWRDHVQQREPLHKRYMYLWLLGLPISAPIGLAPIIPNVPFYFCAWRAWCHWKAWNGSKHLSSLFAVNWFNPTHSVLLDQIYNQAAVEFQRTGVTGPSSNLSNSSSSPPSSSSSASTASTSTSASASASVDSKPVSPASSTSSSPSSPSASVATHSRLSKKEKAELDASGQLLLHPSVVPALLSTFDLPASAGVEILRAIEQTKQRLKKEASASASASASSS